MREQTETILKVDVDVVLPKALQPEAERAALRENSANVPKPVPGQPLELAVLKANKWQNGKNCAFVLWAATPPCAIVSWRRPASGHATPI